MTLCLTAARQTSPIAPAQVCCPMLRFTCSASPCVRFAPLRFTCSG